MKIRMVQAMAVSLALVAITPVQASDDVGPVERLVDDVRDVVERPEPTTRIGETPEAPDVIDDVREPRVFPDSRQTGYGKSDRVIR